MCDAFSRVTKTPRHKARQATGSSVSAVLFADVIGHLDVLAVHLAENAMCRPHNATHDLIHQPGVGRDESFQAVAFQREQFASGKRADGGAVADTVDESHDAGHVAIVQQLQGDEITTAGRLEDFQAAADHDIQGVVRMTFVEQRRTGLQADDAGDIGEACALRVVDVQAEWRLSNGSGADDTGLAWVVHCASSVLVCVREPHPKYSEWPC